MPAAEPAAAARRPEGPGAARMQPAVLAVAAALIAALALRAGAEGGARLSLAVLIGAVAGLALYHASFGFTAAWRRLARERRGAGLRAQLVLIGVASALSYPLMAWGEGAGVPMSGWILPMGVASALGAAMFGVGMQLGGGCASGTLYTAGGGSTRMLLTLLFFVLGSVLPTSHWDFWSALPRTRSGVSLLAETGGPIPALAVLFAALGAIGLASVALERRAHGTLEGPRRGGTWLQGPWSLLAGALALAAVCWATFLVLGRPWGITSALALWGAKILAAAGAPVETWGYWSGWRAGQLERSVFADATSVMNFGIMAGALGAAGAAGRFAPLRRLGRRDVLTAVIGGLLMGYGARLAYGCNIGAYLGGLVSGSLHGAWWLLWGFLGSLAGTALRSRLHMDSPLSPQPSGAAS
ncbi:MAG: YeeE/YedE family protein [Paracoccaceae bacterium]